MPQHAQPYTIVYHPQIKRARRQRACVTTIGVQLLCTRQHYEPFYLFGSSLYAFSCWHAYGILAGFSFNLLAGLVELVKDLVLTLWM